LVELKAEEDVGCWKGEVPVVGSWREFNPGEWEEPEAPSGRDDDDDDEGMGAEGAVPLEGPLREKKTEEEES